MHLLNIGGHLVDAGSYKLETDPFMKRSLSTYDHSDWNPGVYVNDHTAVLVDNSQRKIDTLEPRLWDDFNTGVNYYNTGNKVQASAKVSPKLNYKQSSKKWKDIQWNSVNRPTVPPPTIYIKRDQLKEINKVYQNDPQPQSKIAQENMDKIENIPKSPNANNAKESHDQALLRLHQLTLQLHDITVGRKELERVQRKPNSSNPPKKIINKAKKPWRRPINKHKKKRRLPVKRKRVPPPKKKGFQKIKLELKMPKSVQRVADSAGETLDAVLALMVPGHEAAMKRRRDGARNRLSLDDSIMTLAISSGIMAAILAL